MRLTIAITAALVTASAGAQTSGATKKTPAKPATFRIAFVRPHAVEKESKWAAKLLLDVDMRYRKLIAELKQGQTEVLKRRKELELWTPGSEEHDKIKLDIATRNAVLQNKDQLYKKWYREWQAEAYIAVFLEIQKRAEFLAKKRGYAFVLRKNRQPKSGPAFSRLTMFETSAVLYGAAAHDLTQDIIRLIDAERFQAKPEKVKPENASSNGAQKSGRAGKDGK